MLQICTSRLLENLYFEVPKGRREKESKGSREPANRQHRLMAKNSSAATRATASGRDSPSFASSANSFYLKMTHRPTLLPTGPTPPYGHPASWVRSSVSWEPRWTWRDPTWVHPTSTWGPPGTGAARLPPRIPRLPRRAWHAPTRYRGLWELFGVLTHLVV